MAVILERLVERLINCFKEQSRSDGSEIIIITNIEKYFDDEHSPSEIDFALSLLLKEEDSLLYFINYACSCNNKKYVNAAAKGLELTLRLIENHVHRVEKYASNIKKVCMVIMQAKVISADCRAKAYSILIALFTAKATLKRSLFPHEEVKIFVEKLMQELCNASKHSPKVLQKIYELWGVLGEHYETVVSQKAGQIMNNMVKKLQSQTGSRGREDVSMAVLTGCVTGLAGLLVNFNPDGGNEFEDICSSRSQRKHSSSIYQCITKLCVYDPEHSRKLAHRATLELLTRHMSLFWEFMFPEYKWWHTTLKIWIDKQGNDRKAGVTVLARFQQEVARQLSLEERDENKEAFQYFVKYYKETLEDPKTSPQELTLAIQGFGNLSGACSKLMTITDVEVMFSLILQRVQQTFMRLQSEKEKLENLAEFLESLSNIVREIENISEGQLVSLEQLCILAIGCYPSVLPQHQPNIIRAVKTSIINVALIKGNKLDTFLSTVVYQGVIRTCSHIGVGLQGAELQMGEETLANIITYKSYLKLWKSLLSLADDKKLAVRAGTSPELMMNVAAKVYDMIITTLISLIDKLNVSTQPKSQDVKSLENVSMSWDSDCSIEAISAGDMTVLLNVADLYSELLLPATSHLTSWISKLAYVIINKTISFPIIGSFYKLLAVVLKAADQLEYFQCVYSDDVGEVEWTSHYIVKFLEDVLVKLRQYKGDLQVSCLQAVMATPVIVLEPLLQLIAPTLQVVFNVGRSYLELAHKGMEALERWQKELPSERLNSILKDILPSFDPFLRSRGYSGGADNGDNIHVPRSQMRRQKRLTEESELSRLQKRMLEFLSHLNTPTCLALLDQEQTSAVAWSPVKFLQVAVPFPDIRPEIYLDDFLPRVIELALSSERATRSAAGELLHAIVMVFLAKGLDVERSSSESLIQVFKHVAPALLQLGSHPDLLTSQLFNPLIIQMTHWLSSKWMLKSSQTAVLLEAIWDGLTHPTDTGVRDFSAACIREFVTWSIKQLTELDLKQHPLNVKAVIKQINTYCLHPSPYKRFGAALAFNNLYHVLREQETLIDVFWMELFYHFLRNLALSRTEDTQQIVLALDHLERVLRARSELFNKESKKRRVPLELKGSLLKDLLNWLIQQCTSTHETYRKKCMLLVQNLACCIPGCGMVGEFVAGSHMACGDFGAGLGVHFLLPEPLAGPMASIASVIVWLKQLLSSLDCYAWMVGQGFVPNENLLFPGRSSFYAATQYLLSISLQSATPVLEALRGEVFQYNALSVQEETEFKVTKCKVIVQLFEFVSVEACLKDLSDGFWSSQWWKVVCSCTLTPTKANFGINNQDLASKLPDIMYKLLTTLYTHLKSRDLQNLYAALDNSQVADCQTVCSNLKAVFSGEQNVTTGIKNQLQGLMVLHRCGVFSHLEEATCWKGETILKAVANEISDSTETTVEPNPAALNYVRKLLAFAFLLHSDVTLTLQCVLDTKPLKDCKTFCTVTKGEHFTRLFKNQLLDHLTHDPLLQCIDYLLNEVDLYKVELIGLLVKHCEYIPLVSNRRGMDLISKLSNRWHQLVRWAQDNISLQQKVLDIATCISKCFRNTNACFKTAEMKPLATWVLSQIAASETRLPLRVKTNFLKLLPCVAQQNVDMDVELIDALNTLRSTHFPLTFSEFIEGSLEADAYQIAFRQLLSALVQSGNIDILKTIISETRTDENHPCKDDIIKSLSSFIKKLSLQGQTNALDKVFEVFDNTKHCSEGRLIVIHVFLIPLIKAGLPIAVVTFFSKHIFWIQNKFKEKLETRNVLQGKMQLESKIGALSLVEAMFGTLDIKEFLSVNSAIVQASGVLQDKQLSKDLLKMAYDVRMTEAQFPDDTYKTLFRVYQCSAYKTVISIITNGVWNTVNVYAVFIFDEKPSHKVWSRIVPTDTPFSFPIDFDELPKRKKQLVEIKKKILENQSSSRNSIGPSMSVLGSQSLFTSTLNEDITKYDFTGYSVRTYDEAARAMEELELKANNVVVELDVDVLNQHECMPTLCGLINHMVHSGQFPAPEPDQDLKLPAWMECLKKPLESNAQHENVKVFILKLILNCEQCFRPYAKFWLSPIIECIVKKVLGDSINYMVADLIEMLIKWHEIAIPDKSEYDKMLVMNLLEFLILNCATERKDIFKYNLKLISLVLAVWKPSVSNSNIYTLLLQYTVPKNASKDLREQQNIQIGLTIAANLLSQDQLPYEETGKSCYYYMALKANLMDTNKSIYLLCADVIGRLLKKLYAVKSEDLSNEDTKFYTVVCEILAKNTQPSTDYNLDRFILCLHAIQKHYPPIAIRFVAVSKDLIPTLPSNSRVMLLEVLHTALHDDCESNPYEDLLQSVLYNFLQMDDVDTQVTSLMLVKKMLPMVNDEQVESLLAEVIKLSEHSKSRCRDVIYDIVASYYDRRLAGGDQSSHIASTCKDILIKGLVDTDGELQKKMYKFWNEGGRLSSTTCNRIVDVISTLYSPKEEHHFLTTAVCLLLESAAVNPYCIETKVFSNPLTNCTYEEYKITANWRAQHSSLVPMFAQTMSSYIASVATQNEHSFNVRATPASFAFTPTVKSEDEDLDTSTSSFVVPSTSSSFLASGSSSTQSGHGSARSNTDIDIGVFAEPRRTRWIRNKDKISRSFADRNIQQSVKREKMMSERRKKRDAQVKIIRNYRIGDFPDVEIKYIDIVKPLQLLVKRDSVIARQVFVALYAGLKTQSITLPGFPSSVHNILKTTTQYEPSTIATMLDVVLIQPDERLVNFDTITKVCKNSKLLSMGSMLMEQLLLSSNTEPPPAKKHRAGPSQERNNNLWIQLAELYRSMGETDVVKGIFENKMASSCDTLVQEALQYESSRDWKGALLCYQEAIGNAKESIMEDFLYEACFKCCEYMSDWKTLNKCVRDQVNNDLNEIWCDSWTLDHYLPWLFTSEINMALIGESDPTKDFLKTVHDWTSDPNKEEHMKTRLGESLCMVYLLRNDVERCKLYSDNNLMQFIDNWAQLDVLQSKLRAQKLLQLQSMMEIHHYMSLPSERSSNSKWSSSVKELLHHWSKNSPSNLDLLNNWETRALYRHFFASKLQGRMDEGDKVIKDAQLNSQMSLLDCAIQQKNYYVARKYIGFTHTQVKGFEKEENFWLRNSKVKLLQAQAQLKDVFVFEMAVEAAQLLKNVLDRLDTLLPTLQIKLSNQVAVLCSFMESVVQKDPTVLSQLKHGPVYNFKAFTGVQDMNRPEVVTTYLHEKALSSLQKAVEIAEETTTDGSSPSQLAEAYFELAKFSSQGDDINETVMIESLLKSMKFGSSEARQLFPSLLQLTSLSTSNAQLFIDESDNIPEWMFLQWVPQLLSSLDSTKGLIIGHLLERIARVYPSALQFPFLLSCEMYQYSSNKPPQQVVDRLNSLLTRSPTMSALVDALICLHYRPVVILHYHLKRLKQDIENNANESTTYEILKKESFLSAEDVNKVKGALFKSNTKYQERIEQAVATLKNDKQKAITELNKILDEVMKEEVGDYKPENLLKSYSPFLDSFSQGRQGDIEIPGQYTGQARPIPEQHVMIAGFKSQVQIMPSLRHPIRITIIGNDAKERHYLVKFGEDLRQDQRIQQLFGVMNQILATDPDTARRGLSVDTYSVVPLNTRSGLIAWVYDTVPLRNFIIKSELQKHDQAKEEFRKWIFGSNLGNNSNVYAAVYKTYTRKETIENYTRIKNILPSDLLRKAVHQMASSSEAYMYLRSQMLTSHAVLCICHWLLGIGDRHLDNTLVSTKTGRFLGIDFGHAFDTAVGLPIPELMPFRMTPQIQNLAAPLYLKGTLQETMVHTLQTLSCSHRILLNTMYVFIQEPSMNWLNNSHKYNQEHNMEDENEGDWYPRDKINLARRKLQGDHPSWIMETELKSSHRKNSCLQYFVQLVHGVKEGEGVLQENIRATMPEHKLTAREQVQCLLDQATDQHILGKTYLGWEPYV